MRYTKEFKLECIRRHNAGEPINDPGGCKHKTFYNAVRRWVRIWNALGEEGLEDKEPKQTWEDKYHLIQKILNGNSISEIALTNGIQICSLSKWFNLYRRLGVDGLKYSRQGRQSKMVKNQNTSNQTKTQADLEKENELLRAENEYLKKLSALVQKRKDRQPKKK